MNLLILKTHGRLDNIHEGFPWDCYIHRKKFQSDYDVLVCFPVNAIVLLKIFN